MEKYNPKKIEFKWQKIWEEKEIYKAEDLSEKPKKYILIEFPYPSGAGLHVGHCRPYCALDALARKKKMEGNNVLFPIGWDAFGLPTENFAIKNKIHPQEATEKNIANFKKQIKSLGLSFDWSREINTTDPKYYKWTQRIFLKLFEKGLAYQTEMPINWCPSCKIGLANEEVVNGKCERCGALTEKKIKKQWMLKITAYADKLIEGLEKVDYPERVKTQQINWIGKSEGAEIKFNIVVKNEGDTSTCRLQDKFIKVFTTRPDTLFGCTYLVVCPEHEIVAELLKNKCWLHSGDSPVEPSCENHISTPQPRSARTMEPANPLEADKIQNYNEVEKYLKKVKKKSDLERTDLAKEKTGVELKGIQAINPVNNKEIPIFAADYVLPHYGTGSIMAVPAHDERDFEFAKKYGLGIRQVVQNIKRKIVLIHGSSGWNKTKDKDYIEPNIRHWHGWLENELKKQGYIIYNPIMPNDWKPKYEEWKKNIEKIKIDKNTILVGTSCGGAFIIKWLIETKKKVKKVILNAPSKILIEEEYRMKNFCNFDINPEIKNQIEKITVFISNDKPHRIESAYLYAKKINAKLVELKNRGHFVIEDNPKNNKFPELLEEIFDEAYIENGIAINSGQFNGLNTKEFKEKITKWLEKKGVGKKAVNYKLRDWIFSRQHYWGEPIPLVFCENCKNKKYNYILLHGFEGSSQSNFLPWLKKELEQQGHNVFCPSLPNSDKPNINEQANYIFKNTKINQDTVFIGWSLAGVVVMKLLEKTNKKVAKVLFVDSFIKPEFNDHNRPNVEKSCDWQFDFEKIKKLSDEFIVLSDSEFSIIPKKQSEQIAKLFGAKLLFKKPNDGHFCDIIEPEILEQLKNTGWIPIPEKDLPVELPYVEKYQPTKTGESPLTNISKWVNVKCPKCGSAAKRETDTMPNWAGSSWYFLRYLDPQNDKALADFEKIKYWMPVDFYNGGMEHTTLHLLYSRFWHKFLFDIGVVPQNEPYQKRTSHGMVLAEDGRKMSKSFGNVINPDDVVKKFGADALRLYEMFMGPFEQMISWNTDGLVGMKRFLERVWKVFEETMNKEQKTKNRWLHSGDSPVEPIVRDENHNSAPHPCGTMEPANGTSRNDALERLLHQTIKKVTEDIDNFKFNTAISQLMILLNEMERWLHSGDSPVEPSCENNNSAPQPRFARTMEPANANIQYSIFLKLLSPFAPHIAEEIYQQVKSQKLNLAYRQAGVESQNSKQFKSIFEEPWPKYNPELIKEEKINLIIQINGKVRDQIETDAKISEQEAKKITLLREKVVKWIKGKEVKKVIFVKGKLLNIVV